MTVALRAQIGGNLSAGVRTVQANAGSGSTSSLKPISSLGERVRIFNIHGMQVALTGSSAEATFELAEDFSSFIQQDGPADVAGSDYGCEAIPGALHVHLAAEPPPYEWLPAVKAAAVLPDKIVYADGSTTLTDYFGRALVVHNARTHELTVYCTDAAALRDIAYRCIQSAVDRYLSKQGKHAVSALGIAYDGAGSLIVLPPGGGKTTLALRLVRQPGFRLLSDGTPLIDSTGQLHPYLTRPSIRAGSEVMIPNSLLSTFISPARSIHSGTRLPVDLDYFERRTSPAVAPRFIFIGERSLGHCSEIKPIAARIALAAVLGNMSGIAAEAPELGFFKRGILETASAAAFRLRAAVRLVRQSRTFSFSMGQDGEKNSDTLAHFLVGKHSVLPE